jgi:patatin-like phospholipase/acyl hydrolase
MFQILSLSGGGFLGLYSIALLTEIEQQAKAPIARHFDLLAGTSIGGILALALAAEVPASDIQKAFEKHGQEIFGANPPPRTGLSSWWELMSRLRKSKHQAGALRATIECILDKELLIGDLRHPVLVPAINLSRGSPQLFKTPHHEDFKLDHSLRVVDVALATSAAPTYFPLATIGDSLYTDGGLYANSPDMLALHEAVHFFEIPEEQVRILSVGTTTSQFSFAHTSSTQFGILDWFRRGRLLNVIIASQQRSVDSMLEHRLEDRYLRLDEVQSKEQEQALGLDVATDEARGTIKSIARGTFQNSINNPTLRAILNHSPPTPKFFHGPNSNAS